MGHKIITEEDFWICSSGAMPSPFQGTRNSNKTNDGKVFITVEDTSTISWIDFGCKKYMLLMAIVAALVVVVAVAVGVITVATGGAGLILLGAIAGVAGGVIGAVVGGMLCGHKMGPARKWLDSKSDFISTGTKTITGAHVMECKAGGVVQYAPNIKSWLGAIGYASLSYASELVKCAFAGAAVGTAGSLLGVGAGTISAGGTMGTGISLSRASMQLAWPTLRSVGSNILTSFGIGGGWTTAGVALGSRGIFGAESAATTYATDAVDENGEPISVLDSFAQGALPEYEFANRMSTQGLAGLQWSDALLALYFLNLKTDPPGTFRDKNGTLRNSRNNPRGQRPGSFAKDPRKAKSGGKGKAYENGKQKLSFIDKVKPLLKTKPNEAFFWSGKTNGTGGQDVALNIARAKGGITLEGLIAKNKITMPEWDINNPKAIKAWEDVSATYAEQVSGEVRAVIGENLRPGNVWENVELPRLKNNPKVTKITTIDPVTGVETVIFER